MNDSKLIVMYLKSKLSVIYLSASFLVIFFIVFSLSHIPLGTLLYAFALCVFISAVSFSVGFMRFRHKHTVLKTMNSNILFSLDGLPAGNNLIETDYTDLIITLFNAKRESDTALDTKYSDLAEYYSLWAHQIKTPIAAAHLLLRSDEINRTQVLDQIFKIEQYVEMVLLFLRSERGTNDYVFAEYSVDAIVRSSVKRFATSFILKNLTLDYKETTLKVITDCKWLSFVIEQLLSNSLKYTGKGTISVYTVGNQLIIEDTGIGIASEDLPRICERGYTGYNGRSDKKSTGIGLYLCKKVLDELGHGFRFESIVGKGTKAFVSFDTEKKTFE